MLAEMSWGWRMSSMRAVLEARQKGLMRRHGVAGSALRNALSSYEEAMRITSHESHIEIRAGADRQAPIASPDDPRWTSRTAASAGTVRTRHPPVRVRAGHAAGSAASLAVSLRLG
ncbi:hypothetical protein ACWDSD_43060 [Streptomyces spiralis]